MLDASEFLHLVACDAEMSAHATAAADLYRSPYFRAARAYVEDLGAPWRILSAEHGLLDPAAIVAPYSTSLYGRPQRERHAWGAKVAIEIAALAGSIPIVIHAAPVYRDAILAAPIARILDLRVLLGAPEKGFLIPLGA